MKKTIYASDYAKLDSNVNTGGGTDETEILQGLLDKALEWGRVKLVMDGAALVRGLVVHSNTTIECMDKSCGFFLADGSDCAVLRNANPGYQEIQTHNLTLTGGTYNQNCLKQAHHVYETDPALTSNAPDSQGTEHWVIALEFIGVENLNIRDLTIRDQRTFACTVGNFRHVNIENTFIELENEIPLGNQDGFHFWGPGQFLNMRNVGGKTEDDFINIGPDERDGISSITDVLIDGVFLDHAWQGIRMLCHGEGLLDRVTVRNVTGTYNCYGFYVNPWFEGTNYGHFGNITFENIDLRPEENPFMRQRFFATHPPFLFSVGGDMESLTFRNIHWYHPYDDWRVFRIGYAFGNIRCPYEKLPRIRNLLIDGLQILENENAVTEDYIILRGQVDRLTIRDVQVLRPSGRAGGCLLRTQPDAVLSCLNLQRVELENLDCLADVTMGRTERIVAAQVLLENVAEPIRGNAPVIGQITTL